jgi:hypothetical protein
MIAFCVSVLMVLSGCNKYDDSALWDDIDKSYNQLTEIKAQLEALTAQVNMLSAVVTGGAITGITANEDGGYTVRYKGADNEEKTVVIASKDDVNTAPVLGTKKDGDVLYWTITVDGKTDYLKDVDGAKIPVAGRTPAFTIDKDGFWCVNGNPLLDAGGNKVKAEGKTISVISKIETDGAGNAVLTLADGSTVNVPLFEAFNLSLFYGETEIMNKLDIEGSTVPAVVSYVIGGPASDQTIVKAMRQNGLEAAVNATDKTITLTFPEGFEEGSFAVMVVDAEGNILVRPVYVTDKAAVPDYYGIKTADDMAKFALAVNTGAPLKRFMNEEGTVVLLSDVDMSGVESYLPVGTAEAPFEGIFDGKGFAVKNIRFTTDVTSQLNAAIFGALKGTVKNLTVGAEGDVWTITGTCSAGTSIAGVAATAVEGAVIENCTNNVSFDFKAADPKDILVSIAGIAADVKGLAVTKCTNNADVHVKDLANTGNGGKGLQLAGIVGYARAATAVTECTNNGDFSAASGRGGGIVGTLDGSTVVKCTNNGTIEDDKFGQFGGSQDVYNNKRMGGLVGGTSGTTSIEDCVNNGTVITYTGCRTGGFVGHNAGNLSGCVNNGNIFGLAAHDDHGAGWAAGFTSNKDNIVNCTGKGRVGDLAQKDTPEAAPHASYYNAVKYQYLKRIQPEKNMLDWSADFYYEMEQTASKTLATGLNLKSYQWKNVPRKMHVLEVDLTSTAIDLTTAFANDIVPNPNGNKNSNNGFNIRETLSQLCARKRTEGEEVLAGINTGFFDSNDGFTRGMHIEEGEPVFINNQGVRKNLVNHTWGFTTFTDNTASCGKKEFSGKMEIAGKEYEYFSVNDTIVRLSHKTYYANLYTSRYKEVPHADHPELVNKLSKTAFYVVAKYSNGNMTVNNGYAPAVVTAIYDGRTTALDKAPYLSAADEVAVQVTGDKAAEIAAAVKVGDTIKLRADVTVDGASKPIYTQNSTMFQFLKNGKDNTASLAADSSNNTEFDPVTFAAVDQAGTKVWLVVVDGRQIDMSAGVWTSMGVKAYEMYQIAARLGAYNMTRFDGGGSTAMWAYSDGTGALVNTPADNKGERSCMNYIYIRARK